MLSLSRMSAGGTHILCTGSVCEQGHPSRRGHNPAICAGPSSMQEPGGAVCAKTYTEKLKCIKNNPQSHVCSWGSACWEAPSQGAGDCLACPALMSWVLKKPHFLSHIWCFLSGVPSPIDVPASPHDRALPDAWVGSYCHSLQSYGMVLPPEVHPRDVFWDPEVQQLTTHFPKFAASLTDGKHQKKLWFCNYTPRRPCISVQRVHNTQAEHKGHKWPRGGTWTSFKMKSLPLLIQRDTSTDVCMLLSTAC